MCYLGYSAKVSDSVERCARDEKRCNRKKASLNVDVTSDSSEEGKEVATDYYCWFKDGILP